MPDEKERRIIRLESELEAYKLYNKNANKKLARLEVQFKECLKAARVAIDFAEACHASNMTVFDRWFDTKLTDDFHDMQDVVENIEQADDITKEKINKETT